MSRPLLEHSHILQKGYINSSTSHSSFLLYQDTKTQTNEHKHRIQHHQQKQQLMAENPERKQNLLLHRSSIIQSLWAFKMIRNQLTRAHTGFAMEVIGREFLESSLSNKPFSNTYSTAVPKTPFIHSVHMRSLWTYDVHNLPKRLSGERRSSQLIRKGGSSTQ